VPASAPASRPAPDPDPGQFDRRVGLATAGAGAILLISGVAIGRHASSLGDDVTSACRVSCDWGALSSKDAAGRRDATLGWTFDALGGVAIAAGAVLYYAGVRDEHVAVEPRGDGATVSWSTRW
jgi:hypothetical protein